MQESSFALSSLRSGGRSGHGRRRASSRSAESVALLARPLIRNAAVVRGNPEQLLTWLVGN